MIPCIYQEKRVWLVISVLESGIGLNKALTTLIEALFAEHECSASVCIVTDIGVVKVNKILPVGHKIPWCDTQMLTQQKMLQLCTSSWYIGAMLVPKDLNKVRE